MALSSSVTDRWVGIVGADAFNAMSSSAVVINVGRGPTVDEQALFHALSTQRIAGAIIDHAVAIGQPTHQDAAEAEAHHEQRVGQGCVRTRHAEFGLNLLAAVAPAAPVEEGEGEGTVDREFARAADEAFSGEARA